MSGEFDVGVFDGLKQAELQQALRDRDLPLVGGEPNAQMVARLDQYEADALLGGGDETPVIAAPASNTEQPTPPPVLALDTESDGARAKQPSMMYPVPAPGVYEASFPCPGELSDGAHQLYREQTLAMAQAEGLRPHSFGAVHRTGWKNVNGVRHATYAVQLRRR